MESSQPFPPLESPAQYGRNYPDPRANKLNDDLAGKVYDLIHEYVQNRSGEELYFMRGGLGQLTTTNCWYFTYELSEAIQSIVLSEQEQRKVALLAGPQV